MARQHRCWRRPNLSYDIYALIEAAELDNDQESRLERKFGHQNHLITSDQHRLETLREGQFDLFISSTACTPCQARAVSVDIATALRMHDKVRDTLARGTCPG